MDFIVDFETLGQSDNSVLMSMGALAADFTKEQSISDLINKGLYIKINREEQIARGRKISSSTLDWWKKQSSDAVKELLNNNQITNAKDTYQLVRDFFKTHGFDKSSIIWSRGLIDQRWWQSYCESFGFEDFLCFYQWRDIRTALDILVGDSYFSVGYDIEKHLVKHVAVYDCILDFYRLQSTLNG